MKRILVSAIISIFIFSCLLMGIGCKQEGIETTEVETTATEVTSTTTETTSAEISESTVGEKITIKVWDWQVMENYMAAYTKIFEMFMAANPNVTIERKAIASGEFEKQLKAALSGKEAPDLFQVQLGPQVDAYNKAGIVYDWLPDWKADKEWQDLLSYDNPKIQGYVTEGKMVATPCVDQWVHAIYYYKDMLDKYGIEKPETVADYILIASSLNSQKVIPMMTAFGPNSIVWIPNCMWAEFMMQKKGGNVLNDLVTGKMSWEDPVVVESLQAIKDLQKNGVFPKDVNSAEYFPDVLTRFQNKEAFSFYIAGDWTIGSMNAADIENDNIGVMPLPKVWDDSQVGYGASAAIAYGMLPENQNKETIKKLIKFMLSKEAAEVWADNKIHPLSKKAIEVEIKDNLLKTVINEGENPDYWYSPFMLSSNAEIGTRIVENMGKVFLDLMTAQEACTDLQKYTQEVLNK